MTSTISPAYQAYAARSRFWGRLCQISWCATYFVGSAFAIFSIPDLFQGSPLQHVAAAIPWCVLAFAVVVLLKVRALVDPRPPEPMSLAEYKRKRRFWVRMFASALFLSIALGIVAYVCRDLLVVHSPLHRFIVFYAITGILVAMVACISLASISGIFIEAKHREWLGLAIPAVPEVRQFMFEIGQQGRCISDGELHDLMAEYGDRVRREAESNLNWAMAHGSKEMRHGR